MTLRRLIICGFGNVGRAFARLIEEKGNHLRDRWGIDARISAVVDVGGAAVGGDAGLPGGRMADYVESGRAIETFDGKGRPGLSGVEAIASVPADVLVEATPTNLVDAQPARGHMEAAFARKLDVLTANKAPVVLFYREMHDGARLAGCGLHISAATAAALPTLDVGKLCTAGARIESIEGILNGTTNYILTRMAESGCDYRQALSEAQDLGIAETDPTLDVEGLDTRNKILLIANRLMGEAFTPDAVKTRGITTVTAADIRQAEAEGRTLKLIGSCRRAGDELMLSVAPEAIDRNHPLASVRGSEKGISFLTDTMGRITVTGGHSSPRGAAAALLKDLIHATALGAR
ncbi:MAG: homoserine dehydrogenase [Desulfobacterales bacterium]